MRIYLTLTTAHASPRPAGVAFELWLLFDFPLLFVIDDGLMSGKRQFVQ